MFVDVEKKTWLLVTLKIHLGVQVDTHNKNRGEQQLSPAGQIYVKNGPF